MDEPRHFQLSKTPALIAAACLVFIAARAQPPSKPITDPDSYAIFAAALMDDWTVTSAHATNLVIQDTTGVHSCGDPKGPGMAGAWQEALDAFHEANAKPRPLDRLIPIQMPYVLLPRERLNAFFSASGLRGGWDDFHAAYPNAFSMINLSAVGYDRSHTRALMFVSHSCGGLCGEAGFRFFERQADHWAFVKPPKDVQICFVVS